MNPSIMTGSFSNIDKTIGLWAFRGIYTRSVIIFGAFPSMHFGLAYALSETESIFSNPNRFALYYHWLMFWAAIYSNHHYVFDIFAAAVIVRIVRLLYCKKYNIKNKNTNLNNSVTIV